MAKKYNLKEAAYVLGVNENTVRVWIREGKLKATLVRRGDGHYQYHMEDNDIEECLLNHTQHALETIDRYYTRREKERYLDYLDAREEELYQELCVLEQTRHYLEGLEL